MVAEATVCGTLKKYPALWIMGASRTGDVSSRRELERSKSLLIAVIPA
jgi:hypothetical protein